MITNFYPD